MKTFYIYSCLFLVLAAFQGCNEDPILRSIKYKDGILYKSNDDNNIVYPTIFPKGTTGVFRVKDDCEDCLILDPKTGAIDVNKSTSGKKFKIAFITDDKKDTLYTSVLISGISYQSDIYSLSEVLSPYYNNNQALGLPSGSLLDTPPGNENSALKEGLQIGNEGKIDLTKTIGNISQGTFKDGSSKDFKLYYKLNDASKFALNSVDVSVYYYTLKKDIPQYLLDELYKECIIRVPYNNERMSVAPRCRVIVIVVK